ncbi:hypothetical protein TSPI_01679 [Trichinella spiralis]|uniref:Uncharacterized protein n=1 Tax=Trichinella spiralis TaxID=6334 RepID=A0ABR3K8Z8_TRISP
MILLLVHPTLWFAPYTHLIGQCGSSAFLGLDILLSLLYSGQLAAECGMYSLTFCPKCLQREFWYMTPISSAASHPKKILQCVAYVDP